MGAVYSKSEATQMRGLAIIAMVCLHLFCRKDSDVLGTPLLWTDRGEPLVYWLGFVSGICVPLYSLCVGYAQQVMDEAGKSSYTGNLRRCWRLIQNFWIVLVLFTVLSCFFGVRSDMPTTLAEFFRQAFLIKYTNGAWWYLRTYVLIMLLLPPRVLLWPVKLIRWDAGVILSLMMASLDYFIRRFNLIPSSLSSHFICKFLFSYLSIFKVLPFVFMGAYICRGKLFEKCSALLKVMSNARRNAILLIVLAFWIAAVCLTEKALVVLAFAPVVFLVFVLLAKPQWLEKAFVFLGNHSTNIWLVHMFFYHRLFRGLVPKAQYPVLMFLFMMTLCLASSYAIMGIQKSMARINDFAIRKCRKADV